jgi:polar amino acid transport system substrate-binding protein
MPLFSKAAILALIAVPLSLGGCEYPRDPEGTLDRVEGGTMRVGVVESPPWAEFNGGSPIGVEPTLIRGFADELDAEVKWVSGSESELVAAMTGYQLDVIVGGLDRSSPWALEVALTRPYVDTNVEVGGPPGYDPPEDLAGERIWVEENSEAAALLQQEEHAAHPVHYQELSEVDGPALLHSYYIEALGFEPAGQIQKDDDHVMAVPPGENAMLVELGDFLFDKTDHAEELLRAEAEREVR